MCLSESIQPSIKQNYVTRNKTLVETKKKRPRFWESLNASAVNRPHSGKGAGEKLHKRGTVGEVCPSRLPITERRRFVSLKTFENRRFHLRTNQTQATEGEGRP